MSFKKLLVILTAIFLPTAAICELTINPHGFAISVEPESETTATLNLTNTGNEDAEIQLRASLPRDRDIRRPGPRRDDLGDVIDEFRVEGGFWVGLAWDEDEQLMWGLDYEQSRLVGVNRGGEVEEEVRIEGERYFGLCWDGGVFWTGSEGETRLYRIDRNGEVVGSIGVEGGGEGVFGVAWDGENLWYTLLFGEEETLIRQCSRNGQVQRRIRCDDIRRVELSTLVWVEDHLDGHIWFDVSEENQLYQLNVDEDAAEIVAQTNLQNVFYGIGHDGENLWLNGEGDWTIIDDGIVESRLIRFEPREGVVRADDELEIDANINSSNVENGVYPYSIFIENIDDELLIEISAVISVDSPTASITGVITDAENDTTMQNVVIDISEYIITRFSDEDGNYSLQDLPLDEYEITVSAVDFLPLTQAINLEEEVEYELNFALLHSECTPDREAVDIELEQDSERHIEFEVSNGGNGDLTYTVERRPRGFNPEPWELRRSYAATDSVNDSRLEGVVFADGHYYVSGANIMGREDGENMIYVLDYDGQMIDEFPQLGNSNYGMRDLAYDGELIWGSGEERIFGFTTEGECVTLFRGNFSPISALAWDRHREVIWTARKTGNEICAFDRDGNEMEDLILDQKGFRIYGLAYWYDDPDQYPLYILHSPDSRTQMLYKMNPVDGDTIFVATLDPEEGGMLGGAVITRQYDIYSWVLVNIVNDPDGDRIDVWHVWSNMSWMLVDPAAGVIPSDDSRMFDLLLDAHDLLEDNTYEGEVVFVHDGVGGETIIPVAIDVVPGPMPDPFDLIEPENHAEVGDWEPVTFIWEKHRNDDATYRIWFEMEGDDPDSFEVADTTFEFQFDEHYGGFGSQTVRFFWWVEAVIGVNTSPCFQLFTLYVSGPGACEDESGTPVEFGIQSIYPNPFNSQTRIDYGLPQPAYVNLTIYDLAGRQVAELSHNRLPAGIQSVTFNGSGLTNGVYIIRLEVNGCISQRKIVLVK